MIINIRGTSGSGKTYTARAFMNYCGTNQEIYNPEFPNKPIAHCAYYNMVPAYFIGSYKNVCGGCDSILSQDMACSLVRHFSQFGHTIFEGLLMSHLYARYAALWKELTDVDIPFVFAYMDTPLELCLDRVKQRRLEKGNIKELNPRNTIDHYNATFVTMNKFNATGIDTVLIAHEKDPVKQIVKLLNRDKDMLFVNSYREESFR